MSEEEARAVETTNETSESPNIMAKLGLSTGILIVILWTISGIIALITSIVCFGFSGTLSEKIVGLLLAFFLGPFYFIFYGFNKTYCRNLGANISATVVEAYNTTFKTSSG